MKTTKKVVRPDLEYFGITKVSDKSFVPEGTAIFPENYVGK